MKQADIASFFTRKPGNKLTTAAAQAADAAAPILKDANGTDKKRPREVCGNSQCRTLTTSKINCGSICVREDVLYGLQAAGGASSSAAPSPGHGAAQVPAAGKLKRLRKASTATGMASVQVGRLHPGLGTH